MKVDYVCTSNARPRGEVRAPPPEKRTAAVRASRCAGRRCYTGRGAGCLAPPEPGARIPAQPVSTGSAKPIGYKVLDSRYATAARDMLRPQFGLQFSLNA